MDLNGLHGQLPPEVLARLNTMIAGVTGDSGATPPLVKGIVPAARLVMSSDANDTDTIGIGGHTFTFKTTPGAAGASTQVTRGVSAAATRASLVNAINGVADATVVPATTPFSQPIVADQVGTSVRIRLADAQGGNPIAGVSPSLALAEAITPAADIWNCANLNVAGKTAASAQLVTPGNLTVTAQMITNGGYAIELPFTPTGFVVSYAASTGVPRATTDNTTISGNALLVAMAGGASPALQAGDVVSFVAFA